MAISKSFLGTGWGFPPTFSNKSVTVGMLSDEADIESSLQILLSTRKGERVLRPDYGCNLDELVFEPLTTTFETYIKDLIATAILYFVLWFVVFWFFLVVCVVFVGLFVFL